MVTMLLLNRTPAQRFPDFLPTPIPVPYHTFIGITGTWGARWDTGVRRGKKGTLNPCATVPPFPSPQFPNTSLMFQKVYETLVTKWATGQKMKNKKLKFIPAVPPSPRSLPVPRSHGRIASSCSWCRRPYRGHRGTWSHP